MADGDWETIAPAASSDGWETVASGASGSSASGQAGSQAPRRGGFQNFFAGVNDAIAKTLGAPVDIAAKLLDGHGAGWDNLTPEQRADFTERHPTAAAIMNTWSKAAAHPVGGSETFENMMSALPAGGADPRDVTAQTNGEKIARAAGEGAGSMVVPGLGADAALARATAEGDSFGKAALELIRGNGPLSNAVIGTASGAGGEAAAQAAPDKYKDIARIVGSTVGGVATGGAMAVGDALTNVGRNTSRAMTEPAEVRAARMILDHATNPDAFRQSLSEGAAGVVGDGEEGGMNLAASVPTTFQATGDLGVGALERGVAASPSGIAAFAARREEQNAARLSTLQSLADPNASAQDVSDFVRDRLNDITTEHAAQVTDAADRVANALSKAGGTNFDNAADYGQALRVPLNNLHEAAKAQANELWRAIDPDLSYPVATAPLKDAAGDLTSAIPVTSRAQEGEEAAIFGTINDLGKTTSFGEVVALRSRITDAIRAERRSATGSPTVLRRFALLLDSVDDTLAGTAGEIAENPLDREAMVSRLGANLEADRDQWYAQRNAAAAFDRSRNGGGGAPGAGENAAGGPQAVLGSSGAEGNPGERPGEAPSDQSLPQNGPPTLAGLDQAAVLEAANRRMAVSRRSGEAPLTGIAELDDTATPIPAKEAALSQAAQQLGYESHLTGASQTTASTYLTLIKRDSGVVDADGDQVPLEIKVRISDHPNTAGGEQHINFAPGADSFADALDKLRTAHFADPEEASEGGTIPDIAFGTVGGGRSSPGSGLPADVAARYAAARQATAQEKQTFTRGPVGSVLRQGETAGSFLMGASNVPHNLFDKPEALAAFVKAAGDSPDLTNQMEDYAAFSLRKAAVQNGRLDPAKYQKWVDNHQAQLRQFPDVATNFSNVAVAQDALDTALANQKDALATFQKSAARHFLNDQDPVQAVGKAISNPGDFAKLAASMKSDPDAIAGLRRATIEYMLGKTLSTAEAGTSGLPQIKADTLQKFIADNKLALSSIFSADERASMAAVARDLQRANRSIVAAKIPGGSNTTQDTAMLPGKMSVLERLIWGAVSTAAGSTVGHPVLGLIAGETIAALKAARMDSINKALVELMLDPRKAKAAIEQIPTDTGASAMQNFSRRMSALAANEVTTEMLRARKERQAP